MSKSSLEFPIGVMASSSPINKSSGLLYFLIRSILLVFANSADKLIE
jgi:hypothetical protein